MLWESKFENHFYKIFHGFILPLFQAVINEKAPTLLKEAQADFSSIGKLFGEELFTYIRIFGSLAWSHVLPLYVPDKLLTREVVYQTVGNRLSRFIKEDKKSSWPSFPINCGVYGLENYKHAVLEINQIECLKLLTISNKQYDPIKVSNKL